MPFAKLENTTGKNQDMGARSEGCGSENGQFKFEIARIQLGKAHTVGNTDWL